MKYYIAQVSLNKSNPKFKCIIQYWEKIGVFNIAFNTSSRDINVESCNSFKILKEIKL